MEPERLSEAFRVRKLGDADIDAVYRLSSGNRTFYQYHPPFVTRESIAEDMRALPPGKDEKDKFYLGFFEEDRLIAIMDLILGYPTAETAFIGLFMMERERQGKGDGSRIAGGCAAYLQTLGFKKIRLGADRENPQSNAFWRKNGFSPAGETEAYTIMELSL